MDNEVMELIDQLYTMVSEAWGVPLGNEKCIVERDQVLEILDEIKTAMWSCVAIASIAPLGKQMPSRQVSAPVQHVRLVTTTG